MGWSQRWHQASGEARTLGGIARKDIFNSGSLEKIHPAWCYIPWQGLSVKWRESLSFKLPLHIIHLEGKRNPRDEISAMCLSQSHQEQPDAERLEEGSPVEVLSHPGCLRVTLPSYQTMESSSLVPLTIFLKQHWLIGIHHLTLVGMKVLFIWLFHSVKILHTLCMAIPECLRTWLSFFPIMNEGMWQ